MNEENQNEKEIELEDIPERIPRSCPDETIETQVEQSAQEEEIEEGKIENDFADIDLQQDCSSQEENTISSDEQESNLNIAPSDAECEPLVNEESISDEDPTDASSMQTDEEITEQNECQGNEETALASPSLIEEEIVDLPQKKQKETAAEKKARKEREKAEKEKKKKQEKENKKNQKIIDRQKAKIEKKNSSASEREIPFPEKLLKFLKKFWWVILIVALVIAIAVTGTVHVLNKDFIFVTSEKDFNRIQDGNLFILQKDVTVEGDLTLNVPYPIDLAGHTLTINGKLTVNLGGTAGTFAIGSRKNSDYIDGGSLSAESIEIIAEQANVKLASKIRANSLSVFADNLSVSGEMLMYSTVSLSANELISTGNYSFSADSGTLRLTSNSCYLSSQVSGATVEMSGDRFELSAAARTSDVIAQDSVSLSVYGKIERLLSGGKSVELLSGSAVNKIENSALLRIYEGAEYHDIDGSVQKLVYVKKLATPKDITTYSSGGRIYCAAESVANADTYIFTVGDSPAVKSKSNVFDITDYVIAAGNYTIKIKAVNEENNADAQFIESDISEYIYQSVIKLSTPMNLSAIYENGRIVLRFDTVPLASKYIITINGVELDSFDAGRGERQSFDLTSFILLDNDKSKGAGKYVIKVKAASDLIKNFTPSDENSITYHHYVKLAQPEVKESVGENDAVILNWQIPDNAKYFKIYEITQTGYVWIKTTSQSGFVAEKNKKYAIVAEGYGYYTDSDAFVWESEQ